MCCFNNLVTNDIGIYDVLSLLCYRASKTASGASVTHTRYTDALVPTIRLNHRCVPREMGWLPLLAALALPVTPLVEHTVTIARPAPFDRPMQYGGSGRSDDFEPITLTLLEAGLETQVLACVFSA